MKNLARYAGMTSLFNIARMSPQKRLAVLVDFVLALVTQALDDALESLLLMLGVLARGVHNIGAKKRVTLLTVLV